MGWQIPYAWHVQYTPAIWPPIATAVFLSVLAGYGWWRRGVPGARPFAFAGAFSVLWLAGLAFEAAAVDAATKIAWHRFQALWALPVTTSTACFALEYARPGRWLTRRNLILLFLPSVLYALLVAADARTGWVWRGFEVGDQVRVLPTTLGWAFIFFGWCMVLVNISAFVWLFVRSPQHRWPLALMLTGQVIGRAVYVMEFGRVNPLGPLDPVVAAFFFPFLMYAVALFGFRIFDPLPAARRVALNQIPDGMVVLDDRWRIAGLNPAAEAMLGVSAARARGKTLDEIIGEEQAAASGAAADISLGAGPQARHYTPTTSPLKDPRGLVVGHLFLLRDVTERRQAQAQLVEQERALASLRERELVARELHDGLGQVLAYLKMQAQAARTLLAAGRVAEADGHLAQLVAAAQDMHADVREYIADASGASPVAEGLCAALRQQLSRFSREHRIRTELTISAEFTDEQLGPAATVQLLRIVQEALTNARKHAHAGLVRVSLTAADDAAEITIADDGLGFAPPAAGAPAAATNAATTAATNSTNDTKLPIARDGLAPPGRYDDLAPQTTAGAPAPTGYGLHFMRERAEEAGGSLDVRSAPGQGTTVVVRLPFMKDGGR